MNCIYFPYKEISFLGKLVKKNFFEAVKNAKAYTMYYEWVISSIQG